MMILNWILVGGAYFITALLILLAARLVFDWVTPYTVREHLAEKDNTAVALALAGYLGGVTAILSGLFHSVPVENIETAISWNHFSQEMEPLLLYAALGMAALVLSGVINDKVILTGFSIQEALGEHANVGVGALLASTYLGSGLIVSGGLRGSIDPSSFVTAFLLGQAGLVLFARLYRIITPEDDLKEVRSKELGGAGNVAVGVAWGGYMVAYSIILMTGLSHSATWDDRLPHFAWYAVIGLILLPVVRLLGGWLLVPGVRLNQRITKDGGIGAGILKATLAIAISVVIALVF